MKKPTRVKILDTWVPIIYTYEIHDKHRGEYCCEQKEIHIHPDEPFREIKSTVLHEIIHAIFDIAKPKVKLTREQEEKIVLAIEQGLAPIINFKRDKNHWVYKD